MRGKKYRQQEFGNQDYILSLEKVENIKIHDLFVNNKLISAEDFNLKFQTNIHPLCFRTIKLRLAESIGLDKKFSKIVQFVETDEHIDQTLSMLFLKKNRKGSKHFRCALEHGSDKICVDNAKWETIFDTPICQSITVQALTNLNCKFLNNEILDMKARLLLGKTQFYSQICKWDKGVSSRCKGCFNVNKQTTPETLKHCLFDCPIISGIIKNIHLKCRFVKNENQISGERIILTEKVCYRHMKSDNQSLTQGITSSSISNGSPGLLIPGQTSSKISLTINDPVCASLDSDNFLIKDICNNALINYFLKLRLKEKYTKPTIQGATNSIIAVLESIMNFHPKHWICYQASKIFRLLMADFSPG